MAQLLVAVVLIWISAAYGKTCSPNQFQCQGDTCIPEKWRCDGRVDCEDGDTSDEENCSEIMEVCSKEQYQCRDKTCIPKRWVCDGQNDCGDRSDEIESLCGKSCKDDEFECKQKECIPSQWRCDGTVDCGSNDSSDEDNCGYEQKGLEHLFSLATPSEELASTNSSNNDGHTQANALLHESSGTEKTENDHVTSGTRDVESTINEENQTKLEPIVGGVSLPETAAAASVSSDFVDDWNSTVESKNSTESVCDNGTFYCGEGRCIDWKWRCDGKVECNDGSDETNCDEENQTKLEPIVGGVSLPETAAAASVSSDFVDDWNSTVESKNSTVCDNGTFYCDEGRCIDWKWRCDGDVECNDGSDEKNCDTCQEDQFKCETFPKCISQKWRCDDQSDCPDHSDEKGCSKSPTNVDPDGCEEKFFQCTKDKACIEKSWVCDGFPDCEDGTDERVNCPSRCDKTEYRCENMYECIEEKERCDGKEDCDDGSDEKSCKAFSRDHGHKDDLKSEDAKATAT